MWGYADDSTGLSNFHQSTLMDFFIAFSYLPRLTHLAGSTRG